MYSRAERTFLEAVSRLVYGNPFQPGRVADERAALGRDFTPGEPVWSLRVDRPEEPRANAWAIFERARRLADDARGRLRAGASPADLALYEDAVLHTLYG
ncbi:MAG: hypothetical protein ACRD96_12530, partial [Bryobacteraceae bacterium]